MRTLITLAPYFGALLFVVCIIFFSVPWAAGFKALSQVDTENKGGLQEAVEITTPIYCDGDTCPRCQEGILSVTSRQFSPEDSSFDTMQINEVRCSACGIIVL